MTTLDFDDVSKTYGDLVAVSPVTLHVPDAAWWIVVGPNGSGKTTLLRMACGLLSPSAGAVRVDNARAGTSEARRAVSYLSDSPAFYSDLSVAEHFDYLAGLFRDDSVAERARAIFNAFGLGDRIDDSPDTFSRGMKQKTAIALAMARPASILLLDEPTRGLDVAGTQTMIDLLQAANSDGTTVITVTHEPEKFQRRGGEELHVDDGVFGKPRPMRTA
jgi:ABC-type multidrug transport system ATPase subunit